MNKKETRIGIFGGSGFYELLEKTEEVAIKTPFGQPSDKIMLGEYKGKKIAFMPRHGREHDYPPHKVPYKANLWAMKEVGVKQIIAPSACGSLQPEIKPGDFVICDSFVDRTRKREDTFYEGPDIAHMHCGEPYCDSLRKLAIRAGEEEKITMHSKGTVVVIEGPRFSSKAESRWFTKQGWDIINMTQYPEVVLANELGMCYLNISLVTDYDSGLEIETSEATDIMKTFKANIENVKKIIFRMLETMPAELECACLKKIDEAKI